MSIPASIAAAVVTALGRAKLRKEIALTVLSENRASF